MDRLNMRTSMSYWKITISLLAFISITSALSSKCHENNTLSRHHIIKYSEMIRTAMQHSISSSQHTNIVSAFSDACVAKCTVDLIANVLTPKQIRAISDVDILEMQDFISKQHEEATEMIFRKNQENGDKHMPVGGFCYK